MTPSKKILATTLIAAMSTSAMAPLAFASSSDDAVQPKAATDKTAQDVITASDIEVSGTGRNVITGLQYAKAAIDQGQTDVAKDILAELKGMFGEADGKVMMKTNDGYVLPLDTGLSVAEGFKLTNEHEAAFAEAETLMADGNIDQVITTLTGAGVDLVAQIAVLPYNATIDGLNQAAADLDAGNTDKATSAIDAITASIQVEKFATDALPSQGYPMSDIQKG